MFTIYATALRKALIKSRVCCGDLAATETGHSFCAREATGEGTWARSLIDAGSGGGAGGPAFSCSCRLPCAVRVESKFARPAAGRLPHSREGQRGEGEVPGRGWRPQGRRRADHGRGGTSGLRRGRYEDPGRETTGQPGGSTESRREAGSREAGRAGGEKAEWSAAGRLGRPPDRRPLVLYSR